MIEDDRVNCRDCRRRDNCRDRVPIPLRCQSFQALPGHPDQRTGRERWPDLAKQIAEIRAMDEEFRKARR